MQFFYSLMDGIVQNSYHPFSILLLQIIAIIITARSFGFIFRKIGQPTVIGEIIAGIVLGPSLLGLFFPQISNFLFPLNSLDNLHYLSQIGLILFMFIIGMELDTSIIKKKANSVVITVIGSVVIPFSFGVILSLYLFPEFGTINSTFFQFAIFIGISMSITALPVLARIIQERKLTKTYLGTFAITIAAANDIIGWFLLASIIAIIKAENLLNASAIIVLTAIYILLMVYFVKPILRRVGSIYVSKENLNKTIIALIFLFLLFSAYITEMIGIHALFGAFIAGVVMPKNQNFKNILIDKIEDISIVLLLPLFFVFTGLRTEIGLINDAHLLFVSAIIIVGAVVGKCFGTLFFAKIVGNNWRDSVSLGILMNTRGLMELIVLNIGYDLGVLSAEVFTMLVIMAIVTTLMTGPSLSLANRIFNKIENRKPINLTNNRVLMSFANPPMGSHLLKIASLLFSNDNSKNDFTAIHCTPAASIETKNIAQFEEDVFFPIKTTADALAINLKTIYLITEQIQKEIITITQKEDIDLLLVGAAKSVFIENFVGGKIKGLIDKVNCQLGVFINHDIEEFNKIVAVIHSDKDFHLLAYCKQMLDKKSVSIFYTKSNDSNEKMISNFYDSLQNTEKNKFEIKNIGPNLQLINQFDLVVLSLNYWQENSHQKQIWNNIKPSMLIIKDKAII